MAEKATNEFVNPYEYRLIYVFQINDDQHKGLLKIGDTTFRSMNHADQLPPSCTELNQAAKKRIDIYTKTAATKYTLLYTELAQRQIQKGGKFTMESFRDHDVHAVLKNSQIPRKEFESGGREWFELDLDTAKRAISAVRRSLHNLSGTSKGKTRIPIVLRPEQEEAVSLTVKRFEKTDKMLWNAKMRFGKTFSALELIRRLKTKKNIILTHRPVVDEEWYASFDKIFDAPDGYIYGSKNHGTSLVQLLKSGKKFIYFASIQDLRGSSLVGGKFDKNDDVFSTQWDLVIVDEAHEGTQTALGNEVVKTVFKEGTSKFLALSGTPFNLLDDYSKDDVYTWDYIKEQEAKENWDVTHFGDSNPYSDLPRLRIYTYDLGKLTGKANESFMSFEDKAFNFTEFFRTWTGDIARDYRPMPEGAHVGNFVHEHDVENFLTLLTREDDNGYPYASQEYRRIFRHTLWMLPGVAAAKALKSLMLKHPIFGTFNIVNVAGEGDEEKQYDNALKEVQGAIKDAEEDGYTITLSCGRLTTGVTVSQWTGVFMLAGSSSTSASSYLQTIFRVQSPDKSNGKVKENAYVFDFAPDRTLKMVASAVTVSAHAGKTTDDDRAILGKFLNYCPVISVQGSEMKKFSTIRMLEQLKNAYAEKVVHTGFDNPILYSNELLKLDELDIEKFNDLKEIVGAATGLTRKDIVINDQGLDNEEYEKQKEKKKPKKTLNDEEKERLAELKKRKETRQKAIQILRGVSVRLPLLIYGADVKWEEDITLPRLVELVDDTSWNEFMPNGVTKKLFKEFIKYYDPEIFSAAARKIRATARDADELPPLKRAQKIAELFNCFKNPDKETVLTPWRVVNMHLGNSLGGWSYFKDGNPAPDKTASFIDQGDVTRATMGNPDAKILELNSKTGLYSLYAALNVFRAKCAKVPQEELTLEKQRELWRKTLADNLFIVCKTPMAKTITQRTLAGYTEAPANIHAFDDLLNMTANKSAQFVEKVTRPGFWKRKEKEMKFDAIIGNPPYQVMDGGNKASASPVYHHFVNVARQIEPSYISMIMPAKWYSGGKGLNKFRRSMLDDRHIAKLYDFTNSLDCFPNVDIAGGVCYFLWDRKHSGDCKFVNHNNGVDNAAMLDLHAFNTFIRYPVAISIVKKIRTVEKRFLSEMVSSRKPFGLDTTTVPEKNGDLTLRYRCGTGHYPRAKVSVGVEMIDKWKVIISYLTAEHAGQPGKDGKFKVLATMEIQPPQYICNETYLVAGAFDTEAEAKNYYAYLSGRFARFLVGQAALTQHISKASFDYVPLLDFSCAWTDDELYKRYNLSPKEIDFIESMIRPMK